MTNDARRRTIGEAKMILDNWRSEDDFAKLIWPYEEL
jgi:hypothetical protein